MKQHQKQQKIIRLGTHGEDYGSWMSNPVFYMIGGLLTLSAVLAALSFSMFHIAALGILFSVAAAALLALLIWCAWIRKQYAFGGGGMMERVHDMKPKMYGDMDAFVQKLRDMGYEDVRLIDTATEVFGSRRRAGMMMLGDSRMLVGRK